MCRTVRGNKTVNTGHFPLNLHLRWWSRRRCKEPTAPLRHSISNFSQPPIQHYPRTSSILPVNSLTRYLIIALSILHPLSLPQWEKLEMLWCEVGGCASGYQLGSCYSTTLVFDQGKMVGVLMPRHDASMPRWPATDIRHSQSPLHLSH